MKCDAPTSRRTILAAAIGCTSFGVSTVTAQPVEEGKEILLAIKRIIDDDLIDQPERASAILGLAILDYRGPNEDVQPVPMIGTSKDRAGYNKLEASLESSDRPQRVTFRKVEFRIYGFDDGGGTTTRLDDTDVVAIFGDKFILASSRIAPHWRPGTDFSNWSGRYPNGTFIYRLATPRPAELLVGFGSLTQLTNVILRINKSGDLK